MPAERASSAVIGPIVTAEEVPPHAVLADVRWYLDGRSGRAAFEAGHVPGAVFVDLDTVLADHGRPPTEGRHPLPSPERFAAGLGALGIADHDVVVAYDDSGGGTAGRLAVMLRAIGRAAAVVDGGMAALLAGRAPATGPGTPRPAVNRTAVPWPTERFATVEEVAALPAGTVHLDARAAERYRGTVEPVDPRAGHIPGAVLAPWADNLRNGRFLPPEELRARFAALGVHPGTTVVASCGSGVSACANVLALEAAGLGPVRLFVASFSGWANDPARPVATGEG